MCIAIPSRIVAIDGDTAIIDVDGVRRKAGLMLVEDVCVGDYVIVHAGYAISRIDADAAEETLALMNQVFQ